MRQTAVVLIAALLAGPSIASADRRELYTSVEVTPGLMRSTDPVTERYTTSVGVLGGGLTATYGITNELHLGLALHYGQATNVAFRDSTVVLSNGTASTGTLYTDVRMAGATLVGQYRFHLRTRLVPVVQAEVGATFFSYENVAHIPSGAGYEVPFKNVSETAVELRASARLEYRFGDSLVASGGVGIVANPGALRSVAVEVPVTIGWIW